MFEHFVGLALKRLKKILSSDVSRGFLGIPFSAVDFRAGPQKEIIVNFREQVSVISMYVCNG